MNQIGWTASYHLSGYELSEYGILGTKTLAKMLQKVGVALEETDER